MAQGDIRRFEDITKMNLNTCLTFLAYESDKNDLEIKRIKKQNGSR